jgi:2-C-methyl-D-erythritol 4-phosphate cytidylyltransferase
VSSAPGVPRRFAAVVTAAGASSRMGDGGKKEYRELRGTPVLARAALPFVRAGLFFRVVITVPKGDAGKAGDLLSPYLDAGAVTLVEGGRTRQQSVFYALRALEEDAPEVVLIHDGARPWVSAALIERVLLAAQRYGACVPLVEAYEAVKEVDGGGRIVRHLHRGDVRNAQTPQGFAFAKLLAAHRRAEVEGIRCADDAEIFAMYDGPVAPVDGEAANRKITFPDDLPEGREAQ